MNTLPFLLSAIALLLSSCSTPVKSYWTHKDKMGPSSLIRPSEIANSPYRKGLRIIEFDEEGDFWEKAQVGDAQQMIDDSNKPLVFVFVHGWRHSADPKDGDLTTFNKFLEDFQEVHRKEVVGVYVGWRGASVKEPRALGFLNNISGGATFWNRNRSTTRMAGVSLASTLWKLKKQTQKAGGQLILIGHSFGGKIVEHAVGASLLASIANRSGSTELTRNDFRKSLPADLVVLINAASEGSHTRQMKMAMKDWPRDEPPGIVSVTTRTDKATKILWPLGVHVNGATRMPPFSGFRRYKLGTSNNGGFIDTESQFGYTHTTAGHDFRLIDYSVDQSPQLLVPKHIKNPKDALLYNLGNNGKRNHIVLPSKNNNFRAIRVKLSI